MVPLTDPPRQVQSACGYAPMQCVRIIPSILIILGLLGLVGWAFYTYGIHPLHTQQQQQARAWAVMGAEMIAPLDLSEITSPMDATRSVYLQALQSINSIRKSDPRVLSVAVFRWYPQRHQWEYVVANAPFRSPLFEATVSPGLSFNPQVSPALEEAISEPSVDTTYVHAHGLITLAGYAPISQRQSAYPLVLGIEMESSQGYQTQLMLWLGILMCLGLAGLCAMILVVNDYRQKHNLHKALLAQQNLAQHNLEAWQQVSKDQLTGAFNRSAIEARLTQEVARAKRYNTALSAILFDLDGLYESDDPYDQQSGDLALKTISQVLEETLRETDVFGRYASKEFLVVLPDVAGAQALLAAQRVQQVITSHPLTDSTGHTIVISASAGLADLCDLRVPTAEELISTCYFALFTAKATGRNSVVLYQSEDSEE